MTITRLSVMLLTLAFIIAFYYIDLPTWAYYACSGLVLISETLLLWAKDKDN